MKSLLSEQLRIWVTLGFSLTCLLSASAINAAETEMESPDIVYTQSNIPNANENTILGFYRGKNGALTPMPGGPYLTGGTGIVDPTYTTASLDGDLPIIINPEKTLLFAVNAGSSSIAVFHILPKGLLSPVKGSPFASGGVNPISLALADDFLYVVNKNRDPLHPAVEAVGTLPNYSVFRVTSKGRLIPVKNSTIPAPYGSSPAQFITSGDEKFAFTGELFGGVIRAFKILPSGRLEQSPNSPVTLSHDLAGTPAAPVAMRTHPKRPILYVAFPESHKVGVYTYDEETGELTFRNAANSSGLATAWLHLNKAGTRLYTSNLFDNSLSVFTLDDPFAPVEIQHLTLRDAGGARQLDMNESESYLFVNEPNSREIPSNAIAVLSVNPDGTLAEVADSPYLISPVEGRPIGIRAK